MEEIEANGIRIYPLPDCDSDEDEDYKEQVRQLKEAVPFAVCGANTLIEVKGRKVRGRQYPWGVVEVENPEHCDFIKLRTMLMYAYMFSHCQKSDILILNSPSMQSTVARPPRSHPRCALRELPIRTSCKGCSCEPENRRAN